MTDKATLLDLARHVEGLDGPCRRADAEIYAATNNLVGTICKSGRVAVVGYLHVAPKFTGSLGASASLMPEGCVISLTVFDDHCIAVADDPRKKIYVTTNAKTEPNARAAAALRAIAEGMD